jgi:H+/Cl- antiporter ClcA
MSGDGRREGDVRSVAHSAEYRRILVLSVVIGLMASVVAWSLLTVVPLIQDAVFVALPDALGYDSTPWWWPLPVLLVAGLVTAVAITRLPGHGGGVPADGLSAVMTAPRAVPGVALAALATLGLGLVLGPSSPVIALGMGTALFVLDRVQKDAPDRVRQVVAASGGFAALAMVLNNPLVAAIILIEAMGIGGSTAALLVLPGLLAAGIGSLVYFGFGSVSGLPTDTYALAPLPLEPLEQITVGSFALTTVIGAAAGIIGYAVVWAGQRVAGFAVGRHLVLVPIAGLSVAALAIAFTQTTGESEYAVLFSGSRALAPVVQAAGTWSIATIALLLLLKAAAWSISMGAFRGGPVFPAVFVGTVGGLLAAELTGLPTSAAIPAMVGASLVAILRLPLAAAVIALLLGSGAGLKATPLVIVAIVVSYLVVNALGDPAKKPGPAMSGQEGETVTA